MKPLTVLLLSFALWVPSAPAFAQNPELASAEQAYRAEDYPKAAELYQTIISRGLVAGEIYYNLGNCYYKMGSYGRAILNYERAQRFMGQDPDLEINLRLANLNVPDRIEPVPRFFLMRLVEGLGGVMTPRGWAVIILLSEWVLLACLAGLLYLQHPAHRRLLTSLFLSAGIFFIVSGGLYLLENSNRHRMQGVVLAEKTEVHSAPEAGSTELFALHEGAKFIVLRQVPGWVEIRLADGKQGWMPKAALEVI